MTQAMWFCVEERGYFIGRVFATESEIRNALGPYITIVGNLVSVWGRPD
jgi:hypothetical protein